jgi:hypothetical protein
LAGLAQPDEPDEDIPDWVARIMGISDGDQAAEARLVGDELDGVEAVRPSEPGFGADIHQGSWADLTWSTDGLSPGIEAGRSGVPHDSEGTSADGESGGEDAKIFEWLRELDAMGTRPEQPPGMSSTAPSEDVPDWVDSMMGVQSLPTYLSSGPTDTLPDWLSEPPPAEAGSKGQLLDASRPEMPQAPQPHGSADETGAIAPQELPVDVPAPVPATSDVVPAFPPEEIRQLDVDAVFASMHMPDWLTELGQPLQASSQDAPPAVQDDEPISPADLPSWVQAMRPAESIAAPAADHSGEGLPPEERGPLLGLHGVLPAIPASALPSGRPKSQSLKLEASERHELHARLLEDLLASETQSLPIEDSRKLGSERLLRWGIGFLLLVVVGGAILSGSRIFPLPAAVPNESIAAIQAIQNIPPDARVLAVFDYEPSTVGEMEATASSLMDHLLLLKHPRLAVVSTSPTGAALAERFMSEVLRDRTYVRGVQYVNLGYLPGGLAGVQAFARDPSGTMPLGASADRVWDSDVLSGAQALSDFAAIIVLTESLEGGRVWVEQTALARGSTVMVLVSSAQAGPMLLPYFDAGQVQGLVAGLTGAAGAEIANGGLPGFVRRYWDAYSLGLYFAVLCITLGSLWQLWVGARERRVETA